MVLYDKIIKVPPEGEFILLALSDCSRPISKVKTPSGRELNAHVELLAIDEVGDFVFHVKEIPPPSPQGSPKDGQAPNH